MNDYMAFWLLIISWLVILGTIAFAILIKTLRGMK